MPSGRTIEAGRAFLRLLVEDEEFAKGINAAARRLDRFGQSAQRIALRLGAVGAAITAPFVAAVKGAADAQEILNRFSQVFGDQEAAASQFAERLGKSVGRSKTEIKDALSTFQSFFVGLGFGSQEARAFSQQLEELAIDFASFNNLSDEEAVQRFISALSGSAEVLDKFGVNIRQSALQQQLLRQGIEKTWSEVTEQEKAIARLAIIMRVMTDQGAVGDAARTSGSFTNQLKALTSSVRDLRDEVGAQLIPVATRYVANLKDSVLATAKWVAENQGLVLIAAKAGIALQGLSLAIGAIGTAARLAAGGVTALKGALVFFVANPIGAAITAISVALASLIATLSLAETTETGPLQGLDVSTLKNTEAAIAKTKARIADLKREIASFVPQANEMDRMVQDLTRHNLRLAEATLKALQAQKQQQTIPTNFPTTPALAPATPKRGPLPVAQPRLPDDRVLGAWVNGAVKMADAADEFARISVPGSLLASPRGRAQFGGRNIEQTIGGDIDRRLLAAAQETNKLLKRTPIIRVGQS